MRFQSIATLTAIAAVAGAKPHSHVHRHPHAIVHRDAKPDNVQYAPAAVATKVVFVLNGKLISEEDARQGIANGTLLWGDDGNLSTSARAPATISTNAPVYEEAHSPAEPNESEYPEPKVSATAPIDPPSSKPTEDSYTPPSDSSSQSWADLVDKNGHCASCDKEFPNGKIACSEFPYGYGALPLTNEGLGGWSGIQDPVYRGSDGYDNIKTVTAASCHGFACCTAGNFCSYGCPNPYLKLSFPKSQGRTGQSVGGLYCNDKGFLEMADGSLGKTLCGKGSDSMTVKVQNKLSKPVSICRTDYPGTESMTFPLTLGPGETGYLANPDQGKYYVWNGQKTSAHYYVNKQGVPESEACQWGDASQGEGNWSPTILGTSFDDGPMKTGFSSLKQNELSKTERLDYDITFTGEGISAPCKYKQSTNQYCQGNDCWDDKDRGCTSSTKSGGSLIIVLSDD